MIFGREPLLDDDEYFNRKATVLAYDQAIIDGKIKNFSKDSVTKEDLYIEAKKQVGEINFSDFTSKYPDLFEKYEKKEMLLDIGISAVIGIIAGISDVFMIGTPEGQSQKILPQFVDQQTNQVVENFASKCGWQYNTELDAKANHARAVACLEHTFKIPYDQRYPADVAYKINNLNTTNHHLLSLAHDPGIIGCISSMRDQFTNTATFIGTDSGNFIKIVNNAGSFQLQGSNMISKLVCAFTNWFGHIMSDISGASGSVTRGAGVPSPIFKYLMALPIKIDGMTFSQLMQSVYMKGYDFRFCTAAAIPVVVNDILIRGIWALKKYARVWNALEPEMPKSEKRKYCLSQSVPFCTPANPKRDLSNMLLVSNACLIAVDTIGATIKSKGNPISFLCNCNFAAWINFVIAFTRDYLISCKAIKTVREANNLYLQQSGDLINYWKERGIQNV